VIQVLPVPLQATNSRYCNSRLENQQQADILSEFVGELAQREHIRQNYGSVQNAHEIF
jgi:hypothetical protein